MSFRNNLQHLRATRNMTQEQLAMLLGVSRQSVTKWEAEKSYPEMDKLIKICQIFECSLDDLVQGDLTDCAPVPDAKVVPSGPATDVCGYDEHTRRFAKRVPTGVAAFVLGVVGLRKGRPCAACSIAAWRLAGESFWASVACSPACSWASAFWFPPAWSTPPL